LLILLLVPRLADLDALVTPDEPLWIARSANFYEALKSGDFAATYQYVHPGVTVMWLGAFGYVWHIRGMPYLMGDQQLGVRQREVQDVLEANGYSILDVLVQLRQIEIIASALVVIALFLCLTKITEFWAAAAAIAFLALDPLHIGFTRLLHLDGLSANLALLAIVAYAWFLASKNRLALLTTAVATGLACLTRSANAVLPFFFAVMAAIDLVAELRVNRTQWQRAVRSRIVPLMIIGVLAFAIIVVLWPAMWVHPIGTLRAVIEGGRSLADSGGEVDTFFRGKPTGAPGPLYYPVVLLHRVGALTLIGLAFALIALVRPRDFGARFPGRLALYLLIFAPTYIAILSLSAKKLDRYVLPVVVGLDLVAGIAWVTAILWILSQLKVLRPQATRIAATGLVVIVLLGQASYAERFRPFYIDAVTPLFGGVSGAQGDFAYTWGEGGKEIAEALMTIPGIEQSTVMAGVVEKTIDYYLPFRLNRPEYGSNLRVAAVWMSTDYVVLTYQEITNRLYPDGVLDWFATQTPIRVVEGPHRLFANIYDIRAVPPPDAYYSNVPKVTWDGVGTVLAARFPESRRVGVDAVSVTLLVDAVASGTEVTVSGRLVDESGVTAYETTNVVTVAPGADGIASLSFKFAVPPDLKPGRYRVQYQLLNPATAAPFAATDAITNQPVTDYVLIGTTLIRPAATSQ
jgi:hypothetical protein